MALTLLYPKQVDEMLKMNLKKIQLQLAPKGKKGKKGKKRAVIDLP